MLYLDKLFATSGAMVIAPSRLTVQKLFELSQLPQIARDMLVRLLRLSAALVHHPPLRRLNSDSRGARHRTLARGGLMRVGHPVGRRLPPRGSFAA
jgi:hypothetical protein